ncbi:hypothetical protein BDV98DRAFT_590266 [Pterulicium gracile]|uniref:Uncharacterized protein n=1 Tax=Pterulicium gracile TaxID=1884261 RepID=A0A5C3QSE8_9AGAR|nr:hypothetical protein BDV98DRAFT_590266 [Pterula gracilis]
MAVASFPKDMFFAYQLIRFGTPGTHNLHCPTTLVYLALYLDYQGDEGANLSALVDLLADLPTLQQFRMGDVESGGSANSLLVTPHRRVCPNLFELHIYHLSVRLDVLGALVRSRTRPLDEPPSYTSTWTSQRTPAPSSPRGSQRDSFQREQLHALHHSSKARGVTVSICGAHWTGFYVNMFEEIMMPACICSPLKDDNQEVWPTEASCVDWEDEWDRDHACVHCVAQRRRSLSVVLVLRSGGSAVLLHPAFGPLYLFVSTTCVAEDCSLT